ncbi:hypothetical protein BCR32DRAFT_245184 [Anaeromyces robustus]|uniref:Uncharacterized protein n=1 Tax=Anaeromyces robustus TaxID=1754192 RepID=A0A1Y1X5R1_9FUNG|nr:hypothetical protein BCR32DRAFT_245184 [Anaeromyces robustus]|eukprot:ORX81042.1 hypothetical protein BCR32DRAFT_245184 [Anaeromyces robustus]
MKNDLAVKIPINNVKINRRSNDMMNTPKISTPPLLYQYNENNINPMKMMDDDIKNDNYNPQQQNTSKNSNNFYYNNENLNYLQKTTNYQYNNNNNHSNNYEHEKLDSIYNNQMNNNINNYNDNNNNLEKDNLYEHNMRLLPEGKIQVNNIQLYHDNLGSSNYLLPDGSTASCSPVNTVNSENSDINKFNNNRIHKNFPKSNSSTSTLVNGKDKMRISKTKVSEMKELFEKSHNKNNKNNYNGDNLSSNPENKNYNRKSNSSFSMNNNNNNEVYSPYPSKTEKLEDLEESKLLKKDNKLNEQVLKPLKQLNKYHWKMLCSHKNEELTEYQLLESKINNEMDALEEEILRYKEANDKLEQLQNETILLNQKLIQDKNIFDEEKRNHLSNMNYLKQENEKLKTELENLKKEKK